MDKACRPPRPAQTLNPHRPAFGKGLEKFIIQYDDIEFIKVIGSGAFGVVSEGIYKPRKQKVAIKQLHMAEDTRSQELFYREVSNLAKVSHPFVLPFVGYTNSPPYCILSKFISNGSLYNALHAASMSLSGTELTVIAYGIADGMRYLHSQDLLHRDLKTQNVLLSKQKIPIICDFGSSRKAEGQKTMTMNSCGTSNYMAPEFLVGRSYNTEIDVYSYGMMLWEMLTKQVPFSGMEYPQVIFTVVLRNNRPDIPEDTPPKLKHLIEACWDQDPNKRPSFERITRLFETGEIQYPGSNPVHAREIIERYIRKCKSKDPMQSISKPKFIPYVCPPKHITTTPAIQKVNKHRDSLPVCINESTNKQALINLTAQRANAYLLTLNPNTPQLGTVLEFFKTHIENNSLPPIPLWPQFLDLLNNTSDELYPQIYDLTIKFAQNHDILDTIAKVPNLQVFLSDKTLDVFLYTVSFVPQIINQHFISTLMSYTLQTENTRKAISLLYKIMSSFEPFRSKIIVFFRSNVLNFTNLDGGDIILKSLFYYNAGTPEMITAYSKSSCDDNIIAAYESTFFLTWGKAEFFTLNEVLKNMISKNRILRMHSFEFIRKFAKGARGTPLENICKHLFKAAITYGDEEAVLLLCDVVDQPNNQCQFLIDMTQEFLTSDKPFLFLNFFTLLMEKAYYRCLLLLNKEIFTYLLTLGRNGPQEIFLLICHMIMISDLSMKSLKYINKTQLNDFMIERSCQLKNPDDVNMSISYICKVAPYIDNVLYCNLVKHYISLLALRDEKYFKCIIGLCALSKQPSTHDTFVKENAFAVFSRLNDPKGEKKPYSQAIFNELKKSGKWKIDSL